MLTGKRHLVGARGYRVPTWRTVTRTQLDHLHSSQADKVDTVCLLASTSKTVHQRQIGPERGCLACSLKGNTHGTVYACCVVAG
jgi:hypothetical protein